MQHQKTFTISDDIIVSKQVRLANYLIDQMVQILFLGIMLFVTSVLAHVLNRPELISWMEKVDKVQEYVYGAFFSIAYYAIFESITARSVGKFVTNTVVVFKDGTKPPMETMFRRSIYRILPLNALFFLWQNRIWHDQFTDTYVVIKSGLDFELRKYHNHQEID